MSVDHVLQRIRSGELPHRIDEGFMFVDVAPPPPPTYTVLSEVELEALREHHHDDAVDEGDDGDDGGGDDGGKPLAASQHDEDDETALPGNDEASADLGDWRAARQRAGRRRIPPGRCIKPQAA